MGICAPFARVYGGFARKISICPADLVFDLEFARIFTAVYVRLAPFSVYPLFYPLVHEIPFYSIEETFHGSLTRRLRRVILTDRNSRCFVVDRNRKLDGVW